MSKLILAINAGSSSVKVTVYKGASSDDEPVALANVEISGLTAPPAKLKYERGDKKIKGEELKGVDSQNDAFKQILEHLEKDDGLTEMSHRNDIQFVCHRVVHGGDYSKPQRIDKDTYEHLEALSDLAPLHNAGALGIVKAVHNELPNCTNIAFFDSSFHSTIPAHTYTYAIDQERARKNGLRKYGFHGLSYAFITRSVASHLRKDTKDLNIVALHLGSGASACCIQSGTSIDTSMGLTPLAGLPGATRSGDVDPSLVFHFTHNAGKPSHLSTKEMHLTTAEEILNKQSGWQAITGTTDFGVISEKAGQGDEKCKLAFDIVVDKIVGYVASYYVKLGGKVAALVFAGGIGEKGVQLRTAIVGKLKCLGFEIDAKKNEAPGDEIITDISAMSTRHLVLVCQTDEQTEMARQCVRDQQNFQSRT